MIHQGFLVCFSQQILTTQIRRSLICCIRQTGFRLSYHMCLPDTLRSLYTVMERIICSTIQKLPFFLVLFWLCPHFYFFHCFPDHQNLLFYNVFYPELRISSTSGYSCQHSSTHIHECHRTVSDGLSRTVHLAFISVSVRIIVLRAW